MRIASIAVLSWLGATVIMLSAGAVVYRERPSVADLTGITVITLVASSVLLLSCYLPGLWWLRRRFGGRLTVLQAAVATSVGLNIPAFVVLAVMATRSGVFAPGESAWFASKFLLFGLAFGLGYARYCQPAAPTRS